MKHCVSCLICNSLLTGETLRLMLDIRRILHGRAEIQNFSLSVEIFFSTWEEKFRISKWPCNVLFYYITPMKCQTILLKYFFGLKGAVYYRNHSNGDIFTWEDNMLFSQVKISSFCAKAHLVFHWCLYNKLGFQYELNAAWYSSQDPLDFQAAFDELVEYTSSADNWRQIKDELSGRGVWFIVIFLPLLTFRDSYTAYKLCVEADLTTRKL